MIVFLLFCGPVNPGVSQVVIYSTSFGTGTNYPTGWVASGTQAANIEISTASVSNSYVTPIAFSAGSNLNDGASGVTAGTGIATLSGQVNTIGYSGIKVLFGARKTAAYTGVLLFEWSSDGIVWNGIGFTDVLNDANWHIINNGVWLDLPIGAENQSDLRFRFSYTRTNGSGNYRIDDFVVQGTSLSGTLATDYFRSRQSGNWNTASTWESSADNTTWITATQPPTSIANVITIRNGHTVTIDAAASADQLTIETGGILNHSDNITFTLDDGVGTDMNIFGTYIIYGPVPAGTGTYVVESGGIIQANGNNGGTADNIAWSSNGRVQFKSGSIFNWNTNLAFNTGGITFFPDNSEKPIFRISSAMGLIGGGANTIINGLLEVNGSVTWGSSGTKTFRDGIIGTGSLIQDNTSGAFIINGTSAQLGGTGTITLSTNGLQIANGAIVSLISNKTINGPGNSITVNNGGTLNCSANNLSGSANFVLSSGGILGIGSSDGITSSSALGNIQTNGRTFNSGAVYIYNGNTNQITGNFSTTPLAGTVHSLVIANTGGNGNNTVTLTNNNTVTDLLYLNTGLFASGLNQTLKIANNGSVYGHGGGNPNNATAGNIEFVGNGSTNGLADGNPSLYSVIINGGVDFNGATTHAAAIMNQLQLKAGAYVADAPFYNSGSSLVYSTGGIYGRNVEWGNSVGLPGYPYNVTVGANTILDLNTNPVAGAQLETGGNLSIGNSTGWGRVYMNNSMAKPLSVGGNLIIGSVDAASASSELGLSNSIGGDLWLYGNFSRYDASSYTDNDRAIFFKGTANASINTPNVVITPAIPTQYFSYAVVDKSAGSEVITLNCPVGISKLITFGKGIITSTASHPLVVVDNANATGASISSFVNGPVRKLGDDNFSFPVGKIVFTTPHYRAIGISGLSSSTTFTAEFIRANSRLLGAVNTSPVQWVSQCEYWNLDRNAGSSSANVTLSWSAQSPCNVAANSYINDLGSLVVVHFNTSTLTWDSHGNNGGYSGDNTTGSVTWNNVSAFSPFALGTTDVRYNPLPQTLNLVSFSAVSRKSDVLIDWSLMSNNDQEEFILEHSRDGVNFEKLKVVPTKVILNLATYSEVDSDPWYGWNYYRLHVTDKQNREKVSNIIKVWYGANELVRILPNPASEKIVINFSDPRSISRIELVNISGQILKQVSTVQFSTEINISQLQAGMYYLRILDKNGLITKPFVKK
ncbi:MAG: T9SS type A sorting domain-containing protein [Lacibacter sp.]